jgi:hypothetical protein
VSARYEFEYWGVRLEEGVYTDANRFGEDDARLYRDALLETDPNSVATVVKKTVWETEWEGIDD